MTFRSPRTARGPWLAALIAFVSVAMVAAGCGSGVAGSQAVGGAAGSGAGASGSGAAAGTLTVLAAASLGPALRAAVPAYEASHPGVRITVATDSSAALETQIEQGAPADLFLSADTAMPRKLVAAGLAAGAPVTYARNRLAIVVPAANPAAIRGPADLGRRGLRIVAAGAAVPITTYAEKLVANLARQPGYPADFAAAYEANVVSRETNVQAVVTKIRLGEGDAAIVYATDAVAAGGHVRSLAVPDGANVTAEYAGVVVSGGRTQAADALLRWLAGPDGQHVLTSFGFLPPS